MPIERPRATFCIANRYVCPVWPFAIYSRLNFRMYSESTVWPWKWRWRTLWMKIGRRRYLINMRVYAKKMAPLSPAVCSQCVIVHFAKDERRTYERTNKRTNEHTTWRQTPFLRCRNGVKRNDQTKSHKMLAHLQRNSNYLSMEVSEFSTATFEQTLQISSTRISDQICLRKSLPPLYNYRFRARVWS